jgi:uncharacterized membrane protein YkgB
MIPLFARPGKPVNDPDWIERASFRLLRLSLAVIYVWFGMLKILKMCAISELISRTVFFLPTDAFQLVLGYWEVAIGVCILWRPLLPAGLLLMLFHMPGTALPLVFLPEACFVHFPFEPTLFGQYIIKNLTLSSAALVIAARLVRPRHSEAKCHCPNCMHARWASTPASASPLAAEPTGSPAEAAQVANW